LLAAANTRLPPCYPATSHFFVPVSHNYSEYTAASIPKSEPSIHSTMSVFTPPPINLKAFIADTQQPIALCFLNVHHERGGLDATGYDMLYGVLQMISEISLLLFPHSHGLEGFLMRRITMLSDRIAGTFHIFGEHIATRLSDARSAMNELPDLGVANEDIRRQNLKVWRRRLR
jgi:hypothetical protein